MKLLIGVNKNRGGEKLLTKDFWNSDGNGGMRGGVTMSSLFETIGFGKK
jgi:hypothetical protein